MKNVRKKFSFVSLLCILLCMMVLVCACDNGNAGNDDTGTADQTNDETTVTTGGDDGGKTPEDDGKVAYTVKIQTAEGGLEGVRVQACKGTLCLAPSLTNATGVATFKLDKDEDISQYHVKINKFPKGYEGSETKEYDFEAGATSMVITFTEYKVSVTDLTAGIEDVKVKVATSDNTDYASGKTSAQGEIIFLLDAGNYTVTAETPENYKLVGDSTSWEFTETQKSCKIDYVKLNNTLDKTVTVKDSDGNIKAGATVTLWEPSSSTAVDTKTTDAEGKVTFTGLNGSTNYSVIATADGISTEKTEFASFSATELTVSLPKATVATEKTYTATVKLADGNTYTASAVTVTLVYFDPNTTTFSIKSTAQTQNGVASFTFIPESKGFYYVSIAAQDLPNGYELGDEGNYYNLFGFEENTTSAEIVIASAPVYGTETDPAAWYNYSNITTPFYSVNNEMTVTLTAGQTYYVQLAWSSGMQLTFTGDATVSYGDATYNAGDTVVFNEESPMQGSAQAVIAITSANGATVTLTTSEAPVVEDGDGTDPDGSENSGSETYGTENNGTENDNTEDSSMEVKPEDDETGWSELIPF
ncbi:MAG: carboxypeptidase regulatory-like domain-containing protein [Clostridia bacterium]|nr:carboxypeptidase regulatory-like domain-containing protein [Clostridia bacterium]